MTSKLENLPSIKGTIEFDVPLKNYTTVKIGGPAEIWLQPLDFDDLANFIHNKPQHIPLTVLGEGSNMLIRDGGIPGAVVHLHRGFDAVEVNDTFITAEAGASCGKVARAAREAGLTGLEFFCGIPGSVGGAVRMNAGAYGDETVDNLREISVITDQGQRKTIAPTALDFKYRSSGLPPGWVITSAVFELKQGDKEQIRAGMRQINRERSTSQPLHLPSSGSWFKNPTLPDGTKGKAWQVVSDAGCRGMQVGEAQVSEKHSNFFVNLGGATSCDMEALSDKVQAIVKEKLNIELQREVRFTGVEVEQKQNTKEAS